MTNLINFKEEIGADWMITFNTYEISSSITSQEIACVNIAERVDLRINSSFYNTTERNYFCRGGIGIGLEVAVKMRKVIFLRSV